MKYLYLLLSSISIIVISLIFHPSSVFAQVACAKILNIQVQGSIQMDKEFQCLVTTDQPNSPNIACGIRIGDLNQWPTNYCPSDSSFGGWNGSTATFNCIIPQQNNVTADTKAELVAYDFRNTVDGDPITCGPQTGKTLSIKINSSGQNGTPVPSTGVSQSPGVSQTPGVSQSPGTTTPRPTQSGPVTGDSDLNKCVGFDVYAMADRVRKTSGSDELAEKVIARFREVCAGNGSSQNPVPSISGGPNVSIVPGQGGTNTGFPASLSEFFSSTKVTTEAMQYIGLAEKCAQNMPMYIQAARQGGLPENLAAVLAGIHYIEGSCNLNQSLRNGFQIGLPDAQGGLKCTSQDTGPGIPIPIGSGCGFATVLDSAIWAARHFVGRNSVPQSLQQLVDAYGLYNGIGNNACGDYNYYISDKYHWCPEKFKGEAHPYGMNYMGALFSEYKDYQWFVLFCHDGRLCAKNEIKAYTRPNAAMIALLSWRKFNNAL